MNNLKRDKKEFYLCKQEEDGRFFKEPILKKLNYQPTSSTGDILAYGADYTMYLTISTTPQKARDFSNGDRCYIYEDIPKEYDKLCSTADYYVYGDPIITSNEGIIRLRKMSGDSIEENTQTII